MTGFWEVSYLTVLNVLLFNKATFHYIFMPHCAEAVIAHFTIIPPAFPPLSCATLTPPASAPFTATPTLTPAHVIAPSQNVGSTRNIDPITRLIITSSCEFWIPARFQLL